MLSVLLVLSLAACGGGGDRDTPIQDFIDGEGAQAQAFFEAMLPGMGLGEGASFTLAANDADNEIIFTFTFGEVEQENLEDGLPNFADYILDTIHPTLEPMAEGLRDAIRVDSLVLTISLLSPDGDELIATSLEV